MIDETIHLRKEEEQPPQSKIFNTSVRGMIALLLSVALILGVALIVIAPFFGVQMPDRVSDQILMLFATGFGAAVGQYFNSQSKEGQKPAVK